jgi:hypothetical protein
MKKLSQLIGLFVYFADHIKNLSYNLQHLKISTDKLKIKNFNWTKEMEQEFLEIAEKIESKILFSFPNQNLPFVLKADASKFAGGAELFQLVSGKKNLISSHSFSFSGTQISWSIPKKEAYAALKAVKKFLVYIDGQSPLRFENLHSNSKYQGFKWKRYAHYKLDCRNFNACPIDKNLSNRQRRKSNC